MKGFVMIANVGFMPENAQSLTDLFSDLAPADILQQLGLPRQVTLPSGKKKELTLEESVTKCRAFAAAMSANPKGAPNSKFLKGDNVLPGLARTCNAIFLSENLNLDVEDLYKETHEELLAKVEALVSYQESPSDHTLLVLSELMPTALDLFQPAVVTDEVIGNVADAIAENQTTTSEQNEGVVTADDAVETAEDDTVEGEEIVDDAPVTIADAPVTAEETPAEAPAEGGEVDIEATVETGDAPEEPVAENGNLAVEPAASQLPSNDINVVKEIVTQLAATATANQETAAVNASTARILAAVVDKLFPAEAKDAAAATVEMTDVK